MRERVRRDRRIEIEPAVDQTEDDIIDELDAADLFVDRLLWRGVQTFRSSFRRVGPVKAMVSKEVGPPPWPWPKVLAKVAWPHASVTAGWRSTAYSFHVMWQPRGRPRF